MQKYFDYALIWDFFVAILIGTGLLIFEEKIEDFFVLPSSNSLDSFGVSLLTISSTLLGFLLTIITVIVTFKKGFEERVEISLPLVPDQVPEASVFNKPKSKESIFSTPIHKAVVSVFICSTYEISIILFTLLILQLKIINYSIYWVFVICVCLLLIIILSIVRCLYIFKLFLNVHL